MTATGESKASRNIKDTQPISVRKGERMICVKVRFHTNNLDGKNRDGRIYPKHAWDVGKISVCDNSAHGIKSKAPLPFTSIIAGKRSVLSVLMKALADHGVTLHLNQRPAKLVVAA